MSIVEILAENLAAIIEQRVTGVIDETEMKEALIPFIPSLAPSEWDRMQLAEKAFGRFSGMLMIDGPPHASLGLVDSVAFDLTGKVFYGPKTEAGWGEGVEMSTAGLGTDLGFTLIKHKRGETGTYGRTAAQLDAVGALDSVGVSLMHWIPSDYDEAILDATNGDMLNSYIQAAFNEVRDDVALVFPPSGELRTSVTITNPRAIPVIGNSCKWRGFFGADVSSDLLLVQPTIERRLFYIRDLEASFSTGGRHVAHLTSDGLPGALLMFDLTNCAFRTIGDGVGATDYAVRLAGLGTHIGSVAKCDIAGGIHATTADRIAYERNLLYGHRGLLLSLIAGAYTTVVEKNGIVARDGITIAKGDNIHILRNQIEQFPGYGANASAFESQLTLYGEVAHPIRNAVVAGNNFGGGANCAAPVTLVANVERARFRDNQYNAGYSSFDVRLLDPSVKYVMLDEQFTRGASRDTSEPLSVYDLGTATRGIWRGSTGLTFSNGWTAGADFALSIDAVSSVVHQAGNLVVGSAAGTSDKITTLPEGYRPRVDTILVCSNNADNNISRLKLQSNGDLFPAGPMPAAGSIIYLSGSYRSKVANSVNIGE